MKDVNLEQVLPEKYVKPMMSMISRFTKGISSPGEVASPYIVAVAIAIVIILWDRPLNELVLTDKEKAALKYAAEQIRADPQIAKQEMGIEMTGVHIKLLESLAQ